MYSPKILLPFVIMGLIVLLSCSKKVPDQDKQNRNELNEITKTDSITELTGTIGDTVIALAYLKKADQAMRTGGFKDAIKWANQAESILRDYLPEGHVYFADCWHTKGRGYNGAYKFEKSDSFYNSALQLRLKHFGENDMKLTESYFGLGNLYFFQDKHIEAIQYYEKARDIYYENDEDNNARLGDILQNLAGSYLAIKENQKVENALMEAIDIYDRSDNSHLDRLANAYSDLAWFQYHRKNDYNNAIDNLNIAISIILDTRGPDNMFLSNAYRTLAGIYTRNGLGVEAETYYNKALRIIEKKYGTESPYAADIYKGIGDINEEIQQYATAELYYLKGLAITRKKKKKTDRNKLYYYNKLSRNYLRQNLLDEALIYVNKSIEILDAMDIEPLKSYYTSIYHTYVDILLKKKDYTNAEKQAIKVLNLDKEFFGEKGARTGYAYSQLGQVYREINNLPRARKNYAKALEIYEYAYGKHHPKLDWIHEEICNLYLDADSLNQALNQIKIVERLHNFTTTDSLENILDLEDLINTLNKKSVILESLYHQTKGADFLQEAYLAQRDMAKVMRYRASEIIDGKIDSDDLLVCNCTQQISLSILNKMYQSNTEASYAEEFFNNMEYGKGIIMRETILNNKVKHSELIDPNYRIQEHQLKNKITELEKKRYTEIENHTSDIYDSRFIQNSNEIFNQKRKYDAFIDTLKLLYPNYYNLKFNNYTISLSGVQDSLLSGKQALLEYFVGDSTIFTFTILKDTFYLHEIKKDFPLENWVEDMLHGIYDPFINGTNRKQNNEKYIEAAQQIYQKLVAHIDQLLPVETEIIIVPDEVLGYIPFDALLVNPPKAEDKFANYHYLLKDHQISYAYSATLLKEMRYRKHRKAPSKNVLAFAPSFDSSVATGDTASLAIRSIDISNNRNWLSPLKYNDDEVLAIDALVGAEVYLDSLATEDHFTAIAGNYRVLHLSTHGKANDKVGDYSFLAFYEQEDSLENEWLYNRELYNLELNADMVVLSACETGIGELQRGEGIISLARGFSYAGAKSIITTLWNVNDLSSKQLMEYFYTHIKAGKTKDAALRQAKLDYLENNAFQGDAPFFWAGVIPIGDMSPVEFKTDWSNVIIYCLAGLIVLFGFITFFPKR